MLLYDADLPMIDDHHVRNVFHISLVERSIFVEFQKLVKNLSFLIRCEVPKLVGLGTRRNGDHCF